MLGVTQTTLVDMTVHELGERHHGTFPSRIQDARVALQGSETAAVAHMLGLTAADVDRVDGPSS